MTSDILWYLLIICEASIWQSSDILLLQLISFMDSRSKYSFLTTSVYVMFSDSLDSSFCISNLPTPVPLILGLRVMSLRALSLFFSVDIKWFIFVSSRKLPDSARCRAPSSRNLDLIKPLFCLLAVYSFLGVTFFRMRLVRFSVNHHVLPVILEIMVTVFRLTLLLLYFLCIRISERRSLSWDSLTVLDDWNPLIWSFLTEALAFNLEEIRILSIYSYSLTAETYGGWTWYCSSQHIQGGRFCFIASGLSFEMYFFCQFGWCSLSFMATGGLLRDSWYPHAIEVTILTQIRRWSDLMTRWYGR